MATAVIDLSTITDIRKNMPCFEHRRSDIYSLVALEVAISESADNFLFETYPIVKETVFYETQHSIAFTNIRCVVPGRKILMLGGHNDEVSK